MIGCPNVAHACSTTLILRVPPPVPPGLFLALRTVEEDPPEEGESHSPCEEIWYKDMFIAGGIRARGVVLLLGDEV